MNSPTTEETIKTMSLSDIVVTIGELTRIVGESATELATAVTKGHYGLADLHRGVINVNLEFINKLQNQKDDIDFLAKRKYRHGYWK